MTSKAIIEDQLIGLELTRKEAKIYLDIYQNGNCSVQEISKRTNLNRITVHSAVEQLIERQLLSESREGRHRTLFIDSANRLKELTDQKLQKLLQIRESAVKTIGLLETLPKQQYSAPNISVYHGIKGYKRLLDEVLEAKGISRVFVDIEEALNLVSKEYLLNYYRRRAAKNINTRFIWPCGPFSKKMFLKEEEFKFKIRTIPKTKSWKVGFYSWNDKVAITSLTEGHIVCTVIKNKEIAWFYQNHFFDSLWVLLEQEK